MGIDPLGGKLFSLIQQKCAPMVPRFTSQNISNFLIAAVLLDKPLPPPLLNALARQAVLQMPRASPRGIYRTLCRLCKNASLGPLFGENSNSFESGAPEPYSRGIYKHGCHYFFLRCFASQ